MQKPILLILTFTLSLFAQSDTAKMNVSGTPFKSETDIVAKRLPNGKYCAGLRIISELDNFSYDSETGIIKYTDNPGEDILYINPDDRYFTAFHVGYEPLKIIFSEIGINIKERQMWNIRIQGGAVDVLPVSFVLEPKDAIVTINGEPMGRGATFQLSPKAYAIQVSKAGYYARQDSIIVTPNNVIFRYDLAKKPDMVFVQGGEFDMGNVGNTFFGKPVHKVTLSSFEIGQTEVTFSEYDVFCRAAAEELIGDGLWGRDTRPVINVTWYDAVSYCNWLSRQEGLTPCYTIDKNRKDPNNTDSSDNFKWMVTCDFTANGYRLPTEAEWEYACRGGKKSKGYRYSGSDNADEVAWYEDNAQGQTHPVGERKANELGIYDMSGNVYEWCWDWYEYGYYSQSPSSNPRGPVSGGYRIIRGGSWNYGENSVHSAYRSTGWAYRGNLDRGFRLLRTK